MGEFSITHIAIVLVIYIVFFGHKKLPDVGRGLGEAIRGFKKAMNSDDPPTQAKQKLSKPSDEPQGKQKLSQSSEPVAAGGSAAEDSLLKDQKEHDVAKSNRS